MKDKKEILMNSGIINFSYVLGTNFIDLFSGLLVSIIVPIFISVGEYAGIKTFMLYVAYVSLLNFGFNDGVYIRHGHLDFEELPFALFKSYSVHLIKIQLFISGVLILASQHDKFFDSKLLLIFLAVNSVILNVNSYLNFVNQFTRRFKLNLINNFISKMVLIILIILLIYNNTDRANSYVFVLTVANSINLFSNIYVNRKIISTKSNNDASSKENILKCYKSGLPIMIGYQSSLLMMGLGQLVVKHRFSTEIFAYYAFTFSIMNLINIFIGAISIWLFPYLIRINQDNLNSVFVKIGLILTLALGFALSSSFLIELIINQYLVKYSESIPFIKILFPLTILYALIKVIQVNAFKIFRMEKAYMIVNVFMFIIALFVYYVASLLSKNPNTIAITTIGIMALYLILMACALNNRIKFVEQLKVFACAAVVIIVYYSITITFAPIVGFIVYSMLMISFALVIILFSRKRGNILWKL
jgi:O-antigen/teichoic acid export membrane protein